MGVAPPANMTFSFGALTGAFWVMLLASMPGGTSCSYSRWLTVGCTGLGAIDIVVRTLEWEASLSEPLILGMLMTSSRSAELKGTSDKMFYFFKCQFCYRAFFIEMIQFMIRKQKHI